MANYGNLKSTIDNNIYENDNQEITGSILNSVLNAMVASLGAGYQFMGMATPSTSPGTPDQNVFYLASQAGTYTNFGGTVLDGKKLYCFAWKNSAWTASIVCSIGSGGLPEAPVDGVLYGRKDEAWEAIPQGEGNGVFKVTATINASTGEVTFDKTYAEITSAYEDGAFVFCETPSGYLVPFMGVFEGMCAFAKTFGSVNKGNELSITAIIDETEEVRLQEFDYGTIIPVSSIPSTLRGYSSDAILFLTASGENRGHFYKWVNNRWTDITATGGGGEGKTELVVPIIISGGNYIIDTSRITVLDEIPKIANEDYSNIYIELPIPSSQVYIAPKRLPAGVQIYSSSNVVLSANLEDYSNSTVAYKKVEVIMTSDSGWSVNVTTGTVGGGGGSYTAGEGITILSNVISLKQASDDELGGIKVDEYSNIDIDEDGIASARVPVVELTNNISFIADANKTYVDDLSAHTGTDWSISVDRRYISWDYRSIFHLIFKFGNSVPSDIRGATFTSAKWINGSPTFMPNTYCELIGVVIRGAVLWTYNTWEV